MLPIFGHFCFVTSDVCRLVRSHFFSVLSADSLEVISEMFCCLMVVRLVEPVFRYYFADTLLISDELEVISVLFCRLIVVRLVEPAKCYCFAGKFCFVITRIPTIPCSSRGISEHFFRFSFVVQLVNNTTLEQ